MIGESIRGLGKQRENNKGSYIEAVTRWRQ